MYEKEFLEDLAILIEENNKLNSHFQVERRINDHIKIPLIILHSKLY